MSVNFCSGVLVGCCGGKRLTAGLTSGLFELINQSTTPTVISAPTMGSDAKEGALVLSARAASPLSVADMNVVE